MPNMPTTQPVLTDPAGGTLAVASDGQAHTIHHKKLNDELEGTAGLVGNTTAPGTGTHEAKIRRRTSPSIITTDDFADLPGAILHTADALSDAAGTWVAAGLASGGSLALDTTNKTTGTASVSAKLGVPNNSLVSKLYVNLAADLPVGINTHVLFDVRFSANDSPPSQNIDLWPKFSLTVATTTGLGGTLASIALGGVMANSGVWYTVAIPLTTLAGLNIRSLGIRRTTDSGSGSWSIVFNIDNIRLADVSAKQVALASATDVALIIPPTYVSGVNEGVAALPSTKSVFDLRPFHTIISRFGGIRHAREWDLDETGATNIAPDLQVILDSLNPGDTLKMTAGAVYGWNSGINMTKDRITLDATGSWWESLGLINSDFPDSWIKESGRFNTVKGVRAFGRRRKTSNGNLLTPIVGTTQTGTVTTLATSGHTAKFPEHSTDGDYIYGRDYRGYVKFAFQLSQSGTTPLDCTVTADNLQGVTHITSTFTVAQGTPTLYEFEFRPVDLMDRTRIQVKKATAGANTITVHAFQQWQPQEIGGGGIYNAGFELNPGSSGFFADDCRFEGIGGDCVTINSGSPTSRTRSAYFRRLRGRVCNRMGLGIVGGKDCTFDDFIMIASGQADCDFEPHQGEEAIENCTLRHGVLALGSAENFANSLWSHNVGMVVDDVDFIQDRLAPAANFIAAGFGMGSRLTNSRFRLIHGASPSGGIVTISGEDIYVDNIELDVPLLQMGAGTQHTDMAGNLHTGGQHYVGAVRFSTTPLDPPVTVGGAGVIAGPISFRNTLLRVRTRSVWIPAEDFGVEGGAAVGVQGTAPDISTYVELDDAATQGVYTTFQIPSDAVAAQTFTVRPVWWLTPTDANTTRAARWQLDAKLVVAPVGSLIDSAGTIIAWTGNAASHIGGEVFRETGQATTGLTVSGGDAIRLALRRLGADALDTHVSNLRLVGIQIDYASVF